jgi:RNA polymerase sigma-70 factor (ECF subfamily)
MGVRALSAVPTTVARAVDPDVGLVAAALEQPPAFLALYDRYFERVFGYARVRIRDVATCEDVTSQVFATALAQIGHFRGEGSFAGWLFQIARNAVIDAQRRPAPEPLSHQAALVADEDPGPEERLLALERVERLHRLVGELQPEQQHLIALRYGAGLAYDDIGEIVGAAPGTVRVRMHRILEELRRRYPHDDA